MLAWIEVIQRQAQLFKIFFHAPAEWVEYQPAGDLLGKNLFRGEPCGGEHLLLIAYRDACIVVDSVYLHREDFFRLSLAVSKIGNIPNVNAKLFFGFPAESHSRSFSGFNVTAGATPSLTIGAAPT